MPNQASTDTEIVAAYLAGDRAALAAMYDRYGASLYDTAASMLRNRHDAADTVQDVFLIAAERLYQLRDPSRLKPWLYAVLRNEVYRRTGKRARTVATDFSEPVAEMSLPTEPADDASNAEYRELTELVRNAAAGLDERDQMVLEYTIRQGLEGDDLAAALGVTAQQSYNLVHRMRQRTERSLGALCVARGGRDDCPALNEILSGWDGQFSVLVRKRVARHIDDCDICEKSRRKFVPLALFGAAPAFAAPPDLRDRVLTAASRGGASPSYGFTAAGGFPASARFGGRLALIILIAAATLLLTTGAGVFLLAANDEPEFLAPAETSTTLATSATAIDTATSILAPTTLVTPTTTTSGVTPTSATTSTSTSSTSTTTSTTMLSVLPPVPSSTPSLPVTAPPVTASPVTAPPVTAPPATAPPVTTPPATAPPVTTPPATAPPATAPPATAPPATAPPVTTPPFVFPGQTTTTTTPGQLVLSSSALEFGTSASTLTVTLSNPGGQTVAWAASTDSPFGVSPATGSLPAGGTAQLAVTYNRNGVPENTPSAGTLSVTGNTAATSASLTGRAMRPPVITVQNAACYAVNVGAGTLYSFSIQVRTEDENPSSPQPTGSISSPSGDTRSLAFSYDAPSWYSSASLSTASAAGPPVTEQGTWTWTVSAADAFGNVSTVNGSIPINPNNC